MNYKALALPLIVYFLHAQAAPIKRQADEIGALEIVNRAITLIGNRNFSPNERISPNFLIGQKVLCYMYDRHTDYYHSLQKALQNDFAFSNDSVEEFKQRLVDFTGQISDELVNATSKEYIAREMLNRTCGWVQPLSDTFVSGCSTAEIAQSCANYRLKEEHNTTVKLFDNYLQAVGALGYISNCRWLSPGSNLPENIINKIKILGKATRC